MACLRLAYRQFMAQAQDHRQLYIDHPDTILTLIDEKDFVAEIMDAHDSHAVLQSLQVLRAIERIVITQRYYGDFSFREIALRISTALEAHLFENEALCEKLMVQLATTMHYLSINTSLEAHRYGERALPVVISADDIRGLTQHMLQLFALTPTGGTVIPQASEPLTSITGRELFMTFAIDGQQVVENLKFVQEITEPMPYSGDTLSLRGQMLPVINLGQSDDTASFLIVQTPWAGQNKRYAVAIGTDITCNLLFSSPVGRAIDPASSQHPLAPNARECWASTTGNDMVFVDWTQAKA